MRFPFNRKPGRISGVRQTSRCRFCGERITFLGGEWTTGDGTIACDDPSAPFVPHKPDTTALGQKVHGG